MASQQIDILTKVLEQSAKVVEDQVDAHLSKLNELDDDDLERLKEKRLEALKKAQKQKQVNAGRFKHLSYSHCWIHYCFIYFHFYIYKGAHVLAFSTDHKVLNYFGV